LISAGEFRASRAISRAVESAILRMIRRFISSFLILSVSHWPVAVYNLTSLSWAQVIFMAVDEDARGRPDGRRIHEGLEAKAARRDAQRVVGNARDNVKEFYAKHDYVVVGEAEALFGLIRHVRMEQILS